MKVEMQMKCVHCGQEQYAPAVHAISNGKHPCVWCGKMSRPMTTEEYITALIKWRKDNDR
jgi:hypothetical protein